MKFLILAALVAVATADVHDDVFHFGGYQKAGFVHQASPVYTSSFATQPAYKQVVANAAPVYSQQYFGKEVAQPVYSQQYYKQVAQPVYSQQYYKQVAQPLYPQQYFGKEFAQPVYSQQYYKQVAQPAYSQQYYKQVAQPLYPQQYFSKEVAQPVFSQYTAKKVAEPVTSQYIAKPVVAAQQYSALSGVSTYASAFNGPQFRILSQVQDQDAAGNYKLAYSTENGIQAAEQGALVAGTEGPVVAAQGSYSYTAPDGHVYTVNYIADENGFRAAGDHLPTPPPVPAEILKSLEENARSDEQYDDQGRRILKK